VLPQVVCVRSLARKESKEALNWHIAFTALYAAVMGAEALVVLPAALYVADAALSIRSAVRVNRGESFRCPLSVRLIR
jgi:uncharacterized Tic20 family protein